VADALEAIQAGRLVKIVPARSKSIALPEGFSPQHFFLRLCAYYPQAAITALVHPRWGTWLGASPELLLRQKDAALETMALAGTRVSSDGQPPSFSPKEKAEQARVAEFIREQLEDHWLRYTQSPPQPVPAGPVWHLMSRFHARWHRSEPALALAQALHPTPAVCGLPRDAALAFLASEEGLDRRLYSGFWGPVGPREMALFVNLRCMELHGRGASLYAGAGVVEGSEPEAEWQETERKMDTLASFLEPAAS
jgi:isochorismate synthase